LQQNREKEAEKEAFFTGNKKILQLEKDEIEIFVQRYGWDMKMSSTGLWYQILNRGEGKNPQEGDKIELQYEMMLLDGEKIYSSEEKGALCFVVEKSGDLIGLHEAVKMLKEGGNARFIIPSYLGYGTIGDGEEIGGSTPIVFIVKSLKII
jgi:peptidyl-prolyl cis-trans isomerase A (cyclophilin A)